MTGPYEEVWPTRQTPRKGVSGDLPRLVAVSVEFSALQRRFCDPGGAASVETGK